MIHERTVVVQSRMYWSVEWMHTEETMMKKNVGGVDKVLRIVMGLVLVVIGLVVNMSTGPRIGVFVVAAIALVTAFTGF